MFTRPKILAFDVIGTTFSIEPLRTELTQLSLPGHTLETWFARTLRDAFAMAATDSFSPFRSILEANLDELASSHSISLPPEQKEHTVNRFASLPAHPDALDAFQLLNSAGLRIFAVSNGAAAASEKLLQSAGLMHFVDRVISVEEIRMYKPRREIYLHAVRTAGVEPQEMALVATHAWDVHGAKNAGLLAGFVSRGQTFPPIMRAPDVLGASLLDVARAFIA